MEFRRESEAHSAIDSENMPPGFAPFAAVFESGGAKTISFLDTNLYTPAYMIITTFQALIYAVIHGFSQFLPISWNAHQVLIPYLFSSWPEPTGIFSGTLSLGALLAVLIYFRHDWASIISSFLQVIIFRKRPMTLDERIPFFLGIATIPPLAASYYFQEQLSTFSQNPLWVALALVIWGVPLWFADSISRRTKGMFDWNWQDSLIIGFTQILWLIPGADRSMGAITGGLFRNYNREAVVKFTFFASAPLLLVSTITNLRNLDFHVSPPSPELSWLSLGVAFVVTLLTSLLTIGGLMRHVQRKGFGQYLTYRIIVAVAVIVVFWFRSRS